MTQCTGKTNSATLKTTQEVEIQTELKVFDHLNIDLQKLINQSQFLENSIYKILEQTIAVESEKDSKSNTLETGFDFKLIIERAKKLAQYEDLEKRIIAHAENNLFIIMITILITTVTLTMTACIWYCLKCGNFNMFRQVSGTKFKDIEALMTTENQKDNKLISNTEIVELPKVGGYPEVDPRIQEIIVIPRERTVRYQPKERTFSPYPKKNQIITKPDWHCP